MGVAVPVVAILVFLLAFIIVRYRKRIRELETRANQRTGIPQYNYSMPPVDIGGIDHSNLYHNASASSTVGTEKFLELPNN